MATDQTYFIDGLTTFERGVNTDISPLLLGKDQLSAMSNATVRGAFISHRPSIRKLELTFDSDATKETFENNLFQGACFYKPMNGIEAIPCQIGGRLFYVEPGTNGASIRDITIPGDPNSSSLTQAWMWQAERYLIVQNGQQYPVFFDGTTSRRSYGKESKAIGLTQGNFTVPAVGATVEVKILNPWSGPLNYPVQIAGSNYEVVSARTSSGTHISGKTLTLKHLYGIVGQVNLVGSPVLLPSFLKTFTTAPFSFPNKLNGHGVPKSGYASVTVNEATLNPNQIGVLKIIQPWTYPPTTRRIYVAGKLFYVNTIHDGGKTLHVLNCANYDPFESPNVRKTVPDGSIAQANFAGSMPQTSLAVLNVFSSPAIGSSVTVDLLNDFTGNIGDYVFVGNSQYQIASYGNILSDEYFITIKNLNATPSASIPSSQIRFESNELPAGRMGVYGMGRNWMALTDGYSFLASDLVGSSSGTAANNFKDAVLNVTENEYLNAGGYFTVPGESGDIRAMVFTATLDVSMGQGPLQVFTQNSVFSCNAPVDRLIWQDMQSPILTQSLIGGGALGQNSTIPANGDTIFRSLDGVRSLIIGRREFDTWGNTPISSEVSRYISHDSIGLAGFSSAVIFDNRLLLTSRGQISQLGTFFQGSLVINFDSLSFMSGKSPSVWEGLWTGVNVLQWVIGRFAGVERAFAYTINNTTNKIELYELSPDTGSKFDYDGASDLRIKWAFETPCLFKGIKGKGMFDLVKLQDGEFYLGDVIGEVDYEVYYRPQFSACWVKWRDGKICADIRDADNPDDDNVQPQNRVAIGLGVPSQVDCDPVNNRPYIIGETFQFRFVFTGSAKFYGATFKASPEPKRLFAPVKCDPICLTPLSSDCEPCKRLECVGIDDYEFYQFQDLFNPLPPVQLYFNTEVVFNKPCEGESELRYDGTLPSWITLDTANGRLIGASGVFQGLTEKAATDSAQAALNNFANAAVLNETLYCYSEPPPESPTLKIQDYTDEMFENENDDPSEGEPPWDGKFTFQSPNGNFKASDESWAYQIQGNYICNAYVYSVNSPAPGWKAEIWNGDLNPLWGGFKEGDSPLGTYDRISGIDDMPESIVIVGNEDEPQSTNNSQLCLPI